MTPVKSITIAFGLAVRRKREALKISQEELADRANVHRTYISSIETGKVGLGLVVAKKISDALCVPLSRLIAETETVKNVTSTRYKEQK
jgi:transcriptional regulator with XRE-family HTH domain